MRTAGRPTIKRLTVIALTVGIVSAPASIGAAPAQKTLARWRMNEGSSASAMVDSGPKGIDGRIGDLVETGLQAGAATYYHWTDTDPGAPPPKPQRLVKVNDDRLNPNSRSFAVTVRFRTDESFGNIIQKGQSGAAGGYFKWQIPDGRLSCLFRGRSPSGQVLSRGVTSGDLRLNDGKWHIVRCERLPHRVRMTIDGTVHRTAVGETGRIHNAVPLTIGGKSNCDQVKVTCDYFVGDIDSVLIQKG